MLGAPAVIVSEGGVGPADRRDRAQRRAVRAPRRPGRRRDRQQGRPRREAGARADARARPGPARDPAARASCRTGRSCRTRRWRWSSRASTARRSTPGPDLDEVIGGIAIGAMEPEHMLQRIGPRSLVIVPGDRDDVIEAIVGARRDGSDGGEGALGLVLTGGYRPNDAVLDAIRARRPVRDARPGGHLPGRLRGPRPAGQDAPGRRRQDRRDQGAALGVPVHRPRPRGRRGGALRRGRASALTPRVGRRRLRCCHAPGLR